MTRRAIPLLALVFSLVSPAWAAFNQDDLEIAELINRAAMGPGVSGGGNGLLGKPLESYTRALPSLPEYRSVVEPVLAVVEKKLPEFAADLRAAVNGKSWFFVPATLPRLRPNEIGVFFPTDQLALQTRYSVWINDNLYKWNRERENGTLLLHELVISLKLRGSFECLLHYSYRSCVLSQGDYDAVRHVTNVLLNQPQISAEDLSRLLSQAGFGHYPVIVRQEPPQPFGLAEIYLALEAERDLDKLPKNCFYEFKVDAEQGALSINLRARNERGEVNRDAMPFAFTATRAPEVHPEVKKTRSGFTLNLLSDPLRTQSKTFRRRMVIEIGTDGITRLSGSWEQQLYNLRNGGAVEWLASPSGPAYSFEPAQVNCVR